jgi:CelD/BcsL family acetyltransferase involved in cellulose biosynthesis
MKNTGVSARTLATPAAIEGLAAEWRALETATPEATGFQSAAWRLSSARGGAEPRVVAVRDNGRLVMLLPLQVESVLGVSIARWLGEPWAQYGDALALPDPRRSDWLAAAQAEIGGWRDVDLVALTRLRADGVLAACGAPLVLSDPAKHSAPYVDIGGEKARRHKSVERRLKKLRLYGALRFETAKDASARREAAAQALVFKRQWLKSRRRFSASLSNADVDEPLLALAEKGVLRAHCLWAGEKLVSVELGLKSGAAYRSLIGGYDCELAEASPGHALTLYLLQALAAEGVTRFDFLPPADPYKMQFATGAAAMGALYRPLNLRGRAAAFTLSRLRPLAKDAIHAISEAILAVTPLIRRAAAPLSRAKGKAAKLQRETPAHFSAQRPE